jgi:hypothetical protein
VSLRHKEIAAGLLEFGIAKNPPLALRIVSANNATETIMSWMPKTQIDELCKFAYLADKEARSDLFRGFIRDENDYTSNFTGALRRIINSNS